MIKADPQGRCITGFVVCLFSTPQKTWSSSLIKIMERAHPWPKLTYVAALQLLTQKSK